MAKRIVTKIGDVFCVDFQDGTKGYFQYIANDLTILNSSVIRAFKTHYPKDMDISIDDIVKDEIAFYAHTVLRSGIDRNAWYKAGKSMELGIGKLEKIIFGQVDENKYSDNKTIDVDPLTNWSIWHINKELVNIGTLPKHYIDNIEIGYIFSSINIVHRMKSGYYLMTNVMFDILKRVPRPEYLSFIKCIIDNIEYFICFKGNYFNKGIIFKESKIVRVTRDEAVVNKIDLVRKKFSDTNWTHRNFITEEEFNYVWNLADNKL